MNIGITGATGFIGRSVIDVALRRGHEVIAFSRHPENSIPGCEMRRFTLDEAPDIEGCDSLIHLAGESILGLWTPAKKRRILESRVLGTRRLVEAIGKAKAPPEALLCGSAIGFYGNGGERELTETCPPGTGFLAETSQAWEAEAAQAVGTRVIVLRTSVVLGRKAGALKLLEPLFRAGLGGRLGKGTQWMSWIHIEDEVRLILFALENMELAGPVNASAPWPVRNAEFTSILGRTVNRPAFFHVPAAALYPLGELRHELLDSKRAVPEVALEHGFGFRHPELIPALRQLLG